VLIPTAMRSGTHLLIDCLINNFAALKNEPHRSTPYMMNAIVQRGYWSDFRSASLTLALWVRFFVATSDQWRYVPTLVGQIREGFSFAAQDLVSTLAMFGIVGPLEWLRWSLGFGTSFDGLLR
jgi:hypothetical protein